jgi:hypothetical protein
LFQTESVFVAVFVAQVSPIAMNVACEEIQRSLSCLFESGQRAGCRDDLAEREKRRFADLLHWNDSFVGFDFCLRGTAASGA